MSRARIVHPAPLNADAPSLTREAHTRLVSAATARAAVTPDFPALPVKES